MENAPFDPQTEALRHLELANINREKNDLAMALFECERAILLAPEWADAHYLRGLLLQSLSRTEEAMAAFQEAARLDPSYQAPFPHDLQWVPWTAQDAWWGLVMGVGLSIIVYFSLGVLFGIFSDDRSAILSLLLALGSLSWVIPVWWFASRKYGVGWATLGFRSFTGTTFAIGCGLMIGFYVVSAMYGAIVFGLFGLEMQPSMVPLSEELSVPWLLPLSAVIVAPIVEEVFFRGFLFAAFRQRHGWVKAALISSALFALIHLQPVAIPPIFLLGFFFAYLYHHSNSIWLPILMHGLVNLWGVIAQFILAAYMD